MNTTTIPLLDQALHFAESYQISLPVFDAVAQRAQSAARADDASPSKLEAAIGNDPALVAELLRQGNSAFFGGLAEVTSVKAAILRLGMQRVAQLVLLATEKSRYVARDAAIARQMTALWHHASATAVAADWIANRGRFAHLAETAFVGGLIHDVGKLFLLRVLDAMISDGKLPVKLTGELVQEILDHAHAEIGHHLLKEWNLPAVYQSIVREHHTERPDGANVALQIVRLANRAANKVGLGLHPADPTFDLTALPEATLLGLTEVALAELEILLEDRAATLA